MSGRLVVKRYARALVETAEEAGKIATVEADMLKLDKILDEAPSIRQFCLRPHSNRSEELNFVKTAFVPYVEEFTARTLVTAVENGRMAAIPFISQAVGLLLEETGHRATVLVESAGKLESKVLEQIKMKMERRTGNEIKLQSKIDPNILGGFRIIWQNRIIDMSALGRLKKVRQLLK